MSIDLKGTGHGTTLTTFGAQPSSIKKSAPAYGFGAATRSVAQKVFVSQAHTIKIAAGTGSPGPAQYTLPPSVGGHQLRLKNFEHFKRVRRCSESPK